MNKGGGNPSAIFGTDKNPSNQQPSMQFKMPKIKKTNAENSSNTSKPTEAIVHRLNHLTLLINSSGIDLNIALNESRLDYSSNDQTILSSSVIEEESIVDNTSNSLSSNSVHNKTLSSLASQSKKRRSVVLAANSANNKNKNIDTITKLRTKSVKFASSASGNNVSYVGKEGLLDAFLVLYDECSSNQEYRKDPLLQEFVKKYEPFASQLARLRVSLSDFECLHVIGRGHFGVVQLVKERLTGQVYALKTLKKKDTLQHKHVAFYEEERDIMAVATSSWITKLQYAFQDHSHLHLIMDYHPGGDLLSLLLRQHGKTMPEEWVKFYTAQTCAALNALHTMGYVHRDVKPDNLLLDRCGHVKLADFGSSCRVAESGLVQASLPAGTPDYVAPEVLAAVDGDGSSGYGVSCDFWSIGVVAYEMLYGKTPFSSDTLITTYANIMQHETRLSFPDTNPSSKKSSSRSDTNGTTTSSKNNANGTTTLTSRNDPNGSAPSDRSGEEDPIPRAVVSEEAKSFLKALLCNAESRLDYQSIIRHDFFLHTNWNSLHQMVPPFIPLVTSPDDTSNFDTFTDDVIGDDVDTASFKGTNGGTSLGRRIPFVGFTFARPLLGNDSSSSSSVSAHTSKEVLESSGGADEVGAAHDTTQLITKLEADLLDKKKQLHNMQLTAAGVGGSSSSSTDKQAQFELEHSRSKAELLERDRDRLKQQLSSKESAIVSLKHELSAERSERTTMESKTISLIKDIKAKWKKEEDKRVQELQERCKLFKGTLDKERVTYSEALGKLREKMVEFTELQQHALQYKIAAHQKDKEAKRLAETVSGLQEKLTSLQTVSSQSQSAKLACQQLEEELTQVQSTVRSLTAERDALLTTVLRLEAECTDVSKLRDQLTVITDKADELETKAYQDMERQARVADEALAVKDALITELKANLQRERREKTHLSNKLASMTEQLSKLHAQEAALQQQLLQFTEDRQREQTELTNRLEQAEHKTREKDRLLVEATRRESNLKCRVQSLESEQSRLESTLEHQLSTSSRRSSCEKTEQLRLIDQLKIAKEAVLKLEQRNEQLVREVEEERGKVASLRLDVRLAERETKAGQERIAYLRETSKENRELIKGQKSSMEEKDQEQAKLTMCISELKEELSAAGVLRQSELDEHKSGAAVYESRISELQASVSAAKQRTEQLSEVNAQLDVMKICKRRAEGDLVESRQETAAAGAGTAAAEQQLVQQQQKCSELQQQVEVLKELCAEQDEQLNQLELLEEKLADQSRQGAQHTDALAAARTELKSARAETNEERSLKIFQERQAKMLKQQVEQQEQQHDQHMEALQEQIKQSALKNLEWSDRVTQLEHELNEAVRESATGESREAELHEAVRIAKQEAAGHITHIHALKESNFQLTQGLEAALDKAELFKREGEDLSRELQQEHLVARDRGIRAEETSQQQGKLIDFLHTKLDDKMKKKKTLSKLFGSSKDKENYHLTPYKTRSHLPEVRFEDIHLLHSSEDTRKECTVSSVSHPTSVPTDTCRLLKTPSRGVGVGVAVVGGHTPEKAFHHRVQPPTPTVVPPTPTGGSRFTPSTPAASKQRIRHNIPHKFERYLLVQGGRCEGCMGSLPRGRFSHRCSHCHTTAHKHCCTAVAATCGLPQQLAQHLTVPAGQQVVHEGWVKVVKSAKVWEFCFVRLLECGLLQVFDHEPSDADSGADLQPTRMLELNKDDCRVKVFSSVPCSEVPTTSSVDLPYVLKVEQVRVGYQREALGHLYLMTTNGDQKKRWAAALEQVIMQVSDSISCSGDGASSVQVQHLMQLTGGASDAGALQPRSIVYLDQQTAVLGCSSGLYSCAVSTAGALTVRARLGTLTEVEQVLCVQDLQQLLCIAGPSRSVFTLPLPPLLTAARHCHVAEPSVPHQQVAGLAAVPCHLLAAGAMRPAAGASDGDCSMFVCAAAEDRISILSWDSNTCTLHVVRQYGTQEACTCCLFTPTALIVAADKLYEVDLKTFTIEEFLDESDTSLAYVVYGTARLASLPLAVLQISEHGKYGEFLVCFNEFAVFVDPYGRRSREHDIKFTRIPIDVAYANGTLYLLYSTCVEVLHLRSDSFTKVTSSDPPLTNSTEFDSSSLSPSSHCHAAFRKLNTPQLLGLTKYECIEPFVTPKDCDEPLTAGNCDTAQGKGVNNSGRSSSIIVSCQSPSGCEVLKLTGQFPIDELSLTWGSLPSVITATDDKIGQDDTSSLSSGVYSISDSGTTSGPASDQQQHGGNSRSDKRKQENGNNKQVHFTNKRSKKIIL